MTSQPSNIEPYIQAVNPVTRDPLEQKATAKPHRQAGSSSLGELGTDVGGASQHGQEGVPASRGYGVHGSGPVDAQEAAATSYSSTRGGGEQVLQNENVNADEQLAPLAEGKVADAVDRKSGTQRAPGAGPAEEQDFAEDLDRKKAEQAEAREAIREARKEGVDVGGGSGRLGNENLTDA